MPDFIMLMHDEADGGDWGPYLERLQRTGSLRGGSAIGGGVCVRKSEPSRLITKHLAGFIRVEAGNLAEAQALLAGDPVFENGGTVEIRELPKTA